MVTWDDLSGTKMNSLEKTSCRKRKKVKSSSKKREDVRLLLWGPRLINVESQRTQQLWPQHMKYRYCTVRVLHRYFMRILQLLFTWCMCGLSKHKISLFHVYFTHGCVFHMYFTHILHVKYKLILQVFELISQLPRLEGGEYHVFLLAAEH